MMSFNDVAIYMWRVIYNLHLVCLFGSVKLSHVRAISVGTHQLRLLQLCSQKSAKNYESNGWMDGSEGSTIFQICANATRDMLRKLINFADRHILLN